MNMQPYLEQYLDNLENLSPELTRNFKLIYELDTRVQNILIEIDNLKAEYLANFKSYDNQTRLAKNKLIDQKYEKCKEFSDEKVQLANQTYELVDKYIRRLDNDLARFEVELNYYRSCGENLDNVNVHAATAAATSLNSNLNTSTASTSDSTSKKEKKKVEQTQPIQEEAPINSVALSLVPPVDVLDMPVDPNEPTYCLCHQVSYGEMIGCDNSECPIEWFHFGCVGLSLATKPKGKWYCPICTEKRKKT